LIELFCHEKNTSFALRYGNFRRKCSKKQRIQIGYFGHPRPQNLRPDFGTPVESGSLHRIGLLFNFENEASGFRYNEEFMLSPFYRQHLFQSGNIRYFGEFFGALNKGENNEENDGENNYTDFAFGLGFGGKYIADNGFLVDFHVGIGRNLFNTDQSPEVVPRVGIAIGKRF
jgi:hypothetical protein